MSPHTVTGVETGWMLDSSNRRSHTYMEQQQVMIYSTLHTKYSPGHTAASTHSLVNTCNPKTRLTVSLYIVPPLTQQYLGYLNPLVHTTIGRHSRSYFISVYLKIISFDKTTSPLDIYQQLCTQATCWNK